MKNIGVGTFTTTPKMKELVNQVLDSGRISYGPMSKRFESGFAKMHGCEYAVLSNRGTSALQVALQAMKYLFLITLFLTFSCGSSHLPKPKGYNRLDLPVASYQPLPDSLP